MMNKNFTYFGKNPLFEKPKSTSNLIRPDKELFKKILKDSFDFKNAWFQEEKILKHFENHFSALHNTKHCIPIINGLWALVITINELKLEGKTEIVMPSLTYRRMADIAAWTNLTPRFCDVNKDTFAISKENVVKCINSETALVLAPHPIVNICDVEGITKLCNENNIPLLFDSVESYYADINGKTVGSFGEAERFSLHASKFLNGFEGGYITTNNDCLAYKLRIAANKGIVDGGHIKNFGFDLQMPAYHAAMALACLAEVDKQIAHNKSIYFAYQESLKDVEGLKLVEYNQFEKRSFKNILIELDDSWPIPREILIELMHKENMLVRPYYFPPLHEMERQYKTIYSQLPNTEYWKKRMLLMPSGYFVSKTDVQLIVGFLNICQANAKSILENYDKSK